MYRIRRLTGGEVNLASLDELTAAVAAGTVTADSEIFHQRAERWLPIASHPHFRIANDRAQSPAHPAPKAAPTAPPAAPSQPQPQQPVLRLVRSDMNATPAEPKPTARWTPPQRSMPAPPRVTGSAAPAVDPATQYVELVAEKPIEEPAPAPAPAPQPTLEVAEPPRPKRVDPATAGLPMLDIEMPKPPRPLREPTPMPTQAKMPMPLALPEPGPMPLGARLATPMPSPAMAPLARSAPKLEPTPLPQPAPAPVAVAPAPEPAPVPVSPAEPELAAPPHAEPAMPLPWAPPAPLDLPPPVLDFSEPAADVETESAIASTSISRVASRWPMVAGALVAIGIVAFLALRPRGEVESLDPKPAAGAPSVTARPAVTTAEAGTRPQITPVVPPGPSPDQAADVPTSDEPVVIKAAPKLKGGLPQSVLGSVGDLNVQMDPTAAQRQKGLDETRKQIETQMQQQ